MVEQALIVLGARDRRAIRLRPLQQYSRQLGSGYSNILQTLVVAALIFIVINFILTWLASKLAGRLSSRTGGDTAPVTSTTMGPALPVR